MKVKLRLHEASEPMIFDNVKNAYTKGPMYCLRLEDGDTLKFPLVSIFSAREGGAYTSQAVREDVEAREAAGRGGR